MKRKRTSCSLRQKLDFIKFSNIWLRQLYLHAMRLWLNVTLVTFSIFTGTSITNDINIKNRLSFEIVLYFHHKNRVIQNLKTEKHGVFSENRTEKRADGSAHSIVRKQLYDLCPNMEIWCITNIFHMNLQRPGISSNEITFLSTKSNSRARISRASSSAFFTFDILLFIGKHDTGPWFIVIIVFFSLQLHK